MILLNRLEKYAAQIGFFSEVQFGFQEGVGCNEASYQAPTCDQLSQAYSSFNILETINHMLERGSKIFSCFLDVRKPLTQSGLMAFFTNCFLYKLVGLKRFIHKCKSTSFLRGHCLGKLTYHRVQGGGKF